MTTVYLNGGAPDYLGYIFDNETSLLSVIKSTLESAGWVTETDAISSNKRLTMKGELSGSYCWIRFSTLETATPGLFTLSIRGDLTGNNTTLSPDTLLLNFNDNVNNQLWLSVDESGGCICTIPFTGRARGVHFGFVKNRVASDDNTCIYVGYLNVHTKFTYVAGNYYNSTAWHHIHDSITRTAAISDQLIGAASLGTTTAAIVNIYHGLLDRFTVSNPGHFGTSTNELALRQYVYLRGSYRGQVSPINQKPILGDYYYIELDAVNGVLPTGTQVNIATSLMPQVFYYRGNIRFAAIGLASLVAGAQVITEEGHRYLSCGSNVETQNDDDFAWQGFRIL